MEPIGRIGSWVARGRAVGGVPPVLLAGGVETLGETAFLQKMLLQAFKLAVEEVVGLMRRQTKVLAATSGGDSST